MALCQEVSFGSENQVSSDWDMPVEAATLEPGLEKPLTRIDAFFFSFVDCKERIAAE